MVQAAAEVDGDSTVAESEDAGQDGAPHHHALHLDDLFRLLVTDRGTKDLDHGLRFLQRFEVIGIDVDRLLTDAATAQL